MEEFNESKINFINWLMTHYLHRNPSVNYLLNFIKSQESILNYIAFSEGVDTAPRGIYISFNDQSQDSFIYYKDNKVYTDSEQAFHDLRLNHRQDGQKFYVEVDIAQIHDYLFYFDVFEENPHLPTNPDLLVATQQNLDAISREVFRNRLIHLSDQAIDAKDFNRLNELRHLLISLDKEEFNENKSRPSEI